MFELSRGRQMNFSWIQIKTTWLFASGFQLEVDARIAVLWSDKFSRAMKSWASQVLELPVEERFPSTGLHLNSISLFRWSRFYTGASERLSRCFLQAVAVREVITTHPSKGEEMTSNNYFTLYVLSCWCRYTHWYWCGVLGLAIERTQSVVMNPAPLTIIAGVNFRPLKKSPQAPVASPVLNWWLPLKISSLSSYRSPPPRRLATWWRHTALLWAVMCASYHVYIYILSFLSLDQICIIRQTNLELYWCASVGVIARVLLTVHILCSSEPQTIQDRCGRTSCCLDRETWLFLICAARKDYEPRRPFMQHRVGWALGRRRCVVVATVRKTCAIRQRHCWSSKLNNFRRNVDLRVFCE